MSVLLKSCSPAGWPLAKRRALTWFERHGSTPITEVPRHWPAPYRELVERRLRRIADDPALRLIEQPEYKRRWNTEPWDEQFKRAARDWLLLRLEMYFFGSERMTVKEENAQRSTPNAQRSSELPPHEALSSLSVER